MEGQFDETASLECESSIASGIIVFAPYRSLRMNR
jgi:hypothetical protein